MSTLEKAIAIAANAHAGQTDKGGAPYILHCLRVMMAVDTLDEKIVAVLHDVVEDTEVDLPDLARAGFSEKVNSAISALTKYHGESRIQAAHRTAKNKIARVVKLADNKDNSDISRIPNPTVHDLARLDEYAKVREILIAGEALHIKPLKFGEVKMSDCLTIHTKLDASMLNSLYSVDGSTTAGMA
jgi:GTP diphosphokinase / guanosine-3',5'-bis(diphosphate) 3'-diphosphatase